MELRNPRGAEPLLAWPGLASLKLTLPLSYLFFKIFFTVYGGASALAALRDPRSGFHFDWELRLPFVPSASLLYLSVPLALLLTPFILRTWRTFTPFFLTLTVETLVAGLFFLLLPVAQNYPERIAAGFWGGVFRFADRLNLEYNELPSLTVAFAVTAALVFARRCGWLGRTLFAAWAIGVIVAGLLMHEHHVLDLASGALLGVVAVGTVHRSASREETLEVLRIEGLLLRERVHSVRRQPRQALATLASLPHWRQTRLTRATDSLIRHLDDVRGGRRRIKGDRDAYVQAVLDGLRAHRTFPESPAGQLAEYLAGELTAAAKHDLIASLDPNLRGTAQRPPTPEREAGNA